MITTGQTVQITDMAMLARAKKLALKGLLVDHGTKRVNGRIVNYFEVAAVTPKNLEDVNRALGSSPNVTLGRRNFPLATTLGRCGGTVDTSIGALSFVKKLKKKIASVEKVVAPKTSTSTPQIVSTTPMTEEVKIETEEKTTVPALKTGQNIKIRKLPADKKMVSRGEQLIKMGLAMDKGSKVTGIGQLTWTIQITAVHPDDLITADKILKGEAVPLPEDIITQAAIEVKPAILPIETKVVAPSLSTGQIVKVRAFPEDKIKMTRIKQLVNMGYAKKIGQERVDIVKYDYVYEITAPPEEYKILNAIWEGTYTEKKQTIRVREVPADDMVPKLHKLVSMGYAKKVKQEQELTKIYVTYEIIAPEDKMGEVNAILKAVEEPVAKPGVVVSAPTPEMIPEKVTKRPAALIAYVLDPDLAVADFMERSQATKLGFKVKGRPLQIKQAAKIQHRLSRGKKEYGVAFDLTVNEIAPFIDMIRTGGITKDLKTAASMVAVQDTLTTSQYNLLSKEGKQLYINANTAISDRYNIGDLYADMPIPPSGRFTTLGSRINEAKKVKARGFESNTPAGYRGLLLRLTDGSLLELYTLNDNLTREEITMVLDKIVGMEPVLVKQYIVAPALDTSLGRPAYIIDKIIETLKTTEAQSTTPTLAEE